MAKEAKEAKEAAVVVVPDRTRLSGLVGTIEERILAFEQIAANLATLALNGWKNAQMCKAACWLADGAGMHPAVFMQNHYCMEIQGKLLVEPKWEFVVGVLQSRLPGFKWTVDVETDDCAEVTMSDASGNKHTVRYTLADAKRQGLLGRGGNMWTSGNTREGCFKQAVKRCGRRIGAAALMDMPVGLDGYEMADAEVVGPTPAQVLDEAVSKAAANEPVDVPFVEEAEAGPEPKSARIRLETAIRRYYGPLSKDILAEKVAVIFNAMVKERTGEDPKASFRHGEVGPVDAERMIEYIEAKIALRGKKAAGKGAPESRNDQGTATPDPAEPAADEDEAPLAEAPAAEAAPPAASEAELSQQAAFDALMGTVHRARKLFKRDFVQSSPKNKHVYYFTDQQTFQQAGLADVVKLQRGPDIVAPVRLLEQLNAILSAACDAKERGGR